MTDTKENFPVKEFKTEMNVLVERYDSRFHNKKTGSPDTEPADTPKATPRTKSLAELTDAEYEEYIYAQFGGAD